MKTIIKLGLFTLGLCVGALPIALVATSCGRDYLDIIDGVSLKFINNSSVDLSKDKNDKKYDVYSATINEMHIKSMAAISIVTMRTLLDVDPSTLNVHFSLDITSKNDVIPEVNFPPQLLSLDKINHKPTYTDHILTVDNTYSNYMAICSGYAEIYKEKEVLATSQVKTLDLWMYYDVHGVGKYGADIDTWAFHLSYPTLKK